jgi:hypothetical protein
MMDDFSRYERMRDAGAEPVLVYRSAQADGLDPVTRLRLLRRVYSLSLVQAKEISIVADNLAESLTEYQERFIGPLEEVLRTETKPARSAKPEI